MICSLYIYRKEALMRMEDLALRYSTWVKISRITLGIIPALVSSRRLAREVPMEKVLPPE
jgi:hypothetical protein